MPLSDLEQQIFMPIFRREGGWVYTDDPDDPGGQTYGGCTIRTLNDWRATTERRALFPDTFKRLAEAGDAGLKADIRECYADRFIRPWTWVASIPLREVVTDAAVNCGNRNATKFLQEAVGSARDGVAGPNTKRMTTRALNRPNGLPLVACKLTRARIDHYARLTQRRPEQSKFIVGWCRRAMDVLEDVL